MANDDLPDDSEAIDTTAKEETTSKQLVKYPNGRRPYPKIDGVPRVKVRGKKRSPPNVRDEDVPRCGATLPGTDLTCLKQAGAGTEHFGQGRCKWHGGNVPIKSGRYSKINREALQHLIDEQASDGDPLNLIPDIELVRALTIDYINRYEEYSAAIRAWHDSYREGRIDKVKPTQLMDLGEAHRMLETLSKMVEREYRRHAVNAISRPNLFRIIQQIVLILEMCISADAVGSEERAAEIRENIKQQIGSLRL